MTETCSFEWDVLIDLETLGTNSRAPILSIGAVMFRLDGQPGGGHFYRNVDLQTCFDAGLEPDGSAFYWWLRQSGRARDSLVAPDGPRPLTEVLADFDGWCNRQGAARIWGHGASFDPVILESAYRAIGLSAPWLYNAVRDTRTLFHAAGIEWDSEFAALVGDGAHNALEDARASVALVRRAWRTLQER